MRQTKSWIVGIACGALCAVCVFMYLQDAGAQVDAARAEALERFGGEQVEVCVAKRDIAAGEVVDASSFEKRMWVTALLPDDPLTQDSDVLGKQVTSTVLKGEVLTSRRFEESSSSIDVPGELTAVSVPARDVQTVSAGTTLIAHSVLVLATNASSSSKSGADSVSWVTLALDPANVQEIVSVAQGSELYFTLPGEDVPEPTVSKSLDANEGQKGSNIQQKSDAASDSGSSQVSQPDGRSAAADASQAEGSASNSDSDEGASHER